MFAASKASTTLVFAHGRRSVSLYKGLPQRMTQAIQNGSSMLEQRPGFRNVAGSFAGWPSMVFAAVFFAIIVFACLLSPDHVLFSTDDNIGNQAYAKAHLPQGFFRYWSDGALLGSGGAITLNWSTVLVWLMPVRWQT